jgi:acetylornithine deacetylase
MNDLSHQPTATALLSALVACPSVNAGERTTFERPYGEGRLAGLLAALLEPWGASVSVQEVFPGRPNLVARFRGRDPRRELLFEAHSDTVTTDDMTIPPFEPTVRAGRLYGRGACDTKGAMAAMLLGIRRVLREDGGMPVNVTFAACCDEEMGARGARALITETFRPHLAVVGEPTDLAICHAHKGTLRWRIRTRGEPAHSSTPERGVNAIYLMARVIDRIRNDVAPFLQRKRHALLGNATISVGTIAGGTQVNVVPSACTIDVDRRLLPGEDRGSATAELIARLDGLRDEDGAPICTVEETQFYEPMDLSTDSAPCRLAADACRAVLGDAPFVTAPWSAHAGIFAALGIPSVLFGPGSIALAHTREESVDIDQVERAAGVVAAMIRRAADLPDWPAP